MVLGPSYWFKMVLDHGIERSLNLYKEKIIRPRGASEEVMNISYDGYGFVMLCLTKDALMWMMMNDGSRS